jgi:hypothetical protein
MREVPEHFRIRIMFIDTVSRDDQADRMPPLPIMRDNTSLFKTRPSRDEIIMDIRQTDYAFDLRPTLMMTPPQSETDTVSETTHPFGTLRNVAYDMGSPAILSLSIIS